jgi:hypothetical protein
MKEKLIDTFWNLFFIAILIFIVCAGIAMIWSAVSIHQISEHLPAIERALEAVTDSLYW